MKYCKKSYKCPYGNAFEKNICAYDENLNDNDICPFLFEIWDDIINGGITEKRMRDIDRLNDFYNKLKEIHKNVPDWRFGQFITNFMEWHLYKYKKDLFYIEEDEMIKRIREYINEIGVKYA